MCLYLDRGEANADSQFAGGSNDGVAVIQDLESVLEERRLDRYEVLEGGQRDGLPQQLPVAAVREVTEDELVRIGHEVVGVQFVLDILRTHLQPELATDIILQLESPHLRSNRPFRQYFFFPVTVNFDMI